MQGYEATCGDGRSREVEEKCREARGFNAQSCSCRRSQFLATKRLEEVGSESCTVRYGTIGAIHIDVSFLFTYNYGYIEVI